jgi:hypothetical protein
VFFTLEQETFQNTIANEYLAKQTAGLFRPSAEVEQESEYVCKEGDIFMLDGELLEATRVDGDIVKYGKYGEDSERRRIGRRERQKMF